MWLQTDFKKRKPTVSIIEMESGENLELRSMYFHRQEETIDYFPWPD